MKFEINSLVKESFDVRREYEIIKQYRYKNNGDTFIIDFDPQKNEIKYQNEKFKVLEISPTTVKIKNDDVLAAEFITYKDGEQKLFYVINNLPDFWDKIESLNWGKKAGFGYCAI